MRTLGDFNLKGKRVLVRCDFNVPLSQEGEILDDFRIRKTIPTIKYLIEKGARVILMSHLGRPEGREEKYSLKPIAFKLEKLFRKPVKFLPDCVGPEVEKEIEKMKEKDVILLENLRFYKEEEENKTEFVKDLSKLGQIYINDAFAVCHRSHASVIGITKFLPSGAGPLLIEEVETLSRLIRNPKKPLIIIIGGNKVKDKAKVIDKFLEIANWILIGNLIFKEIKEKIKGIEKIVSPFLDENALDLDKKTIENFKEKISLAKTIFWSGPLGKIEEKPFQKGSEEIAKAIIESGVISIVGGGETVEFINKIGLTEKFSHVSTGGGAMLEFLSGEKLPGLTALEAEKRR